MGRTCESCCGRKDGWIPSGRSIFSARSRKLWMKLIAEGLVHRDVKPGNILVAELPEGRQAYICGFGLARHVFSVSSLTGDRGFVGTIDYVRPEQVEGGSNRRACRRLFTRLRSIRVPGRHASVRARQRALGRLRSPERAAAAPLGSPPRPVRCVRRGLRYSTRQIAGREVLHLRRAHGRRARGTTGGRFFLRRRLRRRRLLFAAGLTCIVVSALIGAILALRDASPP